MSETNGEKMAEKTQEQQEFEFTVWSLAYCDLTSVDKFLADDHNSGIWTTEIGKVNLAHLLELREKALHAYREGNDELMKAHIESLVAHCTHIGYRFAAHPKAVQGTKQSGANSKAASAPRKLTASQQERIVKDYNASGSEYGSVKELASRFEVSTQTIRNTVKKHNSN